jgi:hypothetical protein
MSPPRPALSPGENRSARLARSLEGREFRSKLDSEAEDRAKLERREAGSYRGDFAPQPLDSTGSQALEERQQRGAERPFIG